jgi:hypothetical protein
MNTLLREHCREIFHTQEARVILFDNGKNSHEYVHTRAYFEHGFEDNIYIDDVVFFEDKDRYFDMKKVSEEIPTGVFIVFPLFHEKVCTGIFVLGTKSFRDFYTQ